MNRQMNRETIIEHVKARDTVIVWTASDPGRYWLYKPGKDCVELIGEYSGITAAGGAWIHGLSGIAALFPLFADLPDYFCRDCEDWHNSDETAEWLLLAKVDRGITESQFRQLHMRLTHPKRFNESPLGHGCIAAAIKSPPKRPLFCD
jgi:hypothetical protein